MKNRFIVILVLLLTFVNAYPGSIKEFLDQLPVSEIEELEIEAFYGKIYKMAFEQPLDHRDPSKGSFTQRIYVSHIDIEKPVVMVTEGYTAGYYYTSELANMLKCNQIIVEHRYFGESAPDSMNFDYLDTWQAASDHHEIIAAFREFYNDKWITTGISKGGQTVMYHSYYYPNDVDVRVPYVAPLNQSLEDPRVYTFLDDVGSCTCRKKIHSFQKNALKRQEELIPAFKKFSDKNGYTYKMVGGVEKAFEYCVLEYSFAFWQWMYADCREIPKKNADAMEIIKHMNRVGGFDYFADEFVIEYRPFFYQALTEMGYYGYDLEEFQDELQHVTSPGFGFTLPDNVSYEYKPVLNEKVDNYIRNEAENFIFIYGEYDTWSSTAAELSGKTNSRIFYKKKGSHRTRIRNMPDKQKTEVTALLNSFLED